MKLSRKSSLIIVSFLAVGLLGLSISYFSTSVNYFDYPRKLSNQIQTIDIIPVKWACDCADWIETSYFDKNPNYEILEEDCIFIEGAQAELEPLESNWNQDSIRYVLRLTGQFYADKGISRTYYQETPEKPKKSRVFRFSKYEFVIDPI